MVLAQSADNAPSIELGQSNFPIERPFIISVIIPNSETRVTIPFPDIPGFTKRGISTSVTPVEVDGKTISNQIITQSYQARAPGRFRLLPFTLTIGGETVHSEGAILIVQPKAVVSAKTGADKVSDLENVLNGIHDPVNDVAISLNTIDLSAVGSAFLALRTSKSSIYAGEGVALTLSFFVADNYPYELMFQALDKQLQTVTKKIRPANSWEENQPINELKPVPVSISGKKFREYRLFQSLFFPLSNQSLRLPAVSLRVGRRPVIGPPTSQPEAIEFTSKPVVVAVRALPAHPLRGRVPVGTFQVEEGIERHHITAGKSVRYTFSVLGQGNIATLPAPTLLNEPTEADVFPPEERYTINHTSGIITGKKTFTYFIVPHRNGPISLANRFQWIYFDPRTARYDTLRPHIVLQVGNNQSDIVTNQLIPANSSVTMADDPPGASAGTSLYAGLETMDSARQPISVPVLVRAVANVLIVVMLLGMVVVFFRR